MRVWKMHDDFKMYEGIAVRIMGVCWAAAAASCSGHVQGSRCLLAPSAYQEAVHSRVRWSDAVEVAWLSFLGHQQG